MSRKIKFLSRKTKKVLDKLSFLWYNKSTAKEKNSKRKRKTDKVTAQRSTERVYTMREFVIDSLTILVKECNILPNTVSVCFLVDNKYPSNWENWDIETLEWEYDIKL